MSEPRLVQRRSTPIEGSIRPPGSKSITCRAYVLAALAEGASRLVHPLRSADTDGLLDALVALGAVAQRDGEDVIVSGVGGRFPRGGAVDLGDGGTPSRFMLAAACLAGEPVRVDGSPQMRARPVGEGVELLRALGGDLEYLEQRGHLPVLVSPAPGLEGGALEVPTTLSSQYVSALLLIGRCLPRGIDLRYTGPLTSAAYVDLTAGTLRDFGVDVQRRPGRDRVAPGPLTGRTLPIEADASSALYWCLAAAIAPGGTLTIRGLTGDNPQPDLGAIAALAAMGPSMANEDEGIRFRGAARLSALDCDCTLFPDGAVALAMAAACAEGVSTLRGLRTLRYKESDRIAALATELERIGCAVTATDETLTIDPAGRHDEPVLIRTYDDHRMALAFAILGLARGNVSIENPGCVTKSYPGFWEDLERFGG